MFVLCMLDKVSDGFQLPKDLWADLRLALKWPQSSFTSQLTTIECISLGRNAVCRRVLGIGCSVRLSSGEY